MTEEEDYKEHLKNALSNYEGVLNFLDTFNDAGIAHNPSTHLPSNWEQDHLLLLGEYLDILDLTDEDKIVVLQFIARLIEKDGAMCVWQTRRNFAAEILFTRDF